MIKNNKTAAAIYAGTIHMSGQFFISFIGIFKH